MTRRGENKLATSDIVIQQARFSAGVNVLPALPQHLLAFHLSASTILHQKRAGTTKDALFNPYDFAFVPAGLDNYCAHDVPIDSLTINLDPALIHHTADAIGLSPQRVELITNFGAHDELMRRVALSLLEEMQQPGLGSKLLLESIANQVAVYILRQQATVQPTRPEPAKGLSQAQLKQALDFIHSQLGEDLSLNAMAAAVHLTPYHFARLFKQSTGQSPHRYVVAQRVEAAKQLLQNHDHTIAYVATQLGFADHAHLTRHFKQIVGVTPKAFQQAVAR